MYLLARQKKKNWPAETRRSLDHSIRDSDAGGFRKLPRTAAPQIVAEITGAGVQKPYCENTTICGGEVGSISQLARLTAKSAGPSLAALKYQQRCTYHMIAGRKVLLCTWSACFCSYSRTRACACAAQPRLRLPTATFFALCHRGLPPHYLHNPGLQLVYQKRGHKSQSLFKWNHGISEISGGRSLIGIFEGQNVTALILESRKTASYA
ncbi:hypothetical protein J6590_048881 [Homalodisca vitripennis]|nr:hypothetical protein J6590_048881 [Homalodisca vitripennis]